MTNKLLFKSLASTFQSSLNESLIASEEDPEITIGDEIENTIADAKENYEKVPDEFIEYKYNDKLNDIRKDIDYFKSRLDQSNSNEAKQKYMKLISELVDDEKALLGITTLDDKENLDKQNYIANKVAQVSA